MLYFLLDKTTMAREKRVPTSGRVEVYRTPHDEALKKWRAKRADWILKGKVTPEPVKPVKQRHSKIGSEFFQIL